MNGVRAKKFKRVVTKSLGGWLLMLPSLALFAFFVFVPMFSNLYLSFFDVKGFKPIDFVGIANYLSVFKDAWFKAALVNTLVYTLWSIVLGFVLPIILGLFLSEVVHLKSLFKVGIYLPNVIPGIATVLIWSMLFSPEKWGYANSILGALHMGSSLWFDNDALLKPLIILTMTWKGAGGTALIYLACFQNVDNSLYEAASLDGAGIFKRIIHVTLPAAANMIKMLLIMQIISVFQIFYEPMVLGGSSRLESVSLMQLVYNLAFNETNRASEAAALGTVITVILMALSFVYMKFTGEKKEKEAAV